MKHPSASAMFCYMVCVKMLASSREKIKWGSWYIAKHVKTVIVNIME